MQLIHPGPDEALLCLRAVHAAAARNGVVQPAARALMEAAKQRVLNIDADIDTLASITPAQLAAGLHTPGLSDQVVQAMIVAVLADGEPDPACFSRLEGFAAALGVTTSALHTVRLLVERHTVLCRLDWLRRSHIKDMLVDQYRHHGGIVGLAEGILGMRGLREDPELAKRYIALGDLPGDTLGHAFFQHYRSNGFAFPGEKLGFPEAGIYHDFSHVLAGYGTTPQGEHCVVGFTAGYKRVNPFYVILLAAFSFGAGVNVTPLDQPHVTGILAEPGLADKFIEAVERGSRCNTDLSDNWDFWPLLPLPLDEARRRLNIT